MKKTINIVMAFALLLGVVSCTNLLDEALRGRGVLQKESASEADYPEGSRLTLGFNVPMPVATKAMTEQPAINSIHVFVFVDNGVSDNGVLFEVQKAELGGLVDKNAVKDEDGTITNATEATVLARWQVNLLMSRTKRRLHFVANLPDNFEMPAAGTAEFSVLQSIQTTGGEVAYWQMVELNNGVLAYTYDGSGTFSYVGSDGKKVVKRVDESVSGWTGTDLDGTYHYKLGDDVIDVAQGDYITTTGHKILDGKGFYASEELSETVSMIPLIRNFARIKVVTSAGTGHNFRMTKAVLVNTPKSGYAAPFDDHNNKFVEAYRNAGSAEISHTTILTAGYPASVPSSSIVTDCPEESAATAAATVNGRDTVLLYMYERGIPTADVTSLLVCGALDGVENRWLKIEIADESGAYFPIYRDFTYEVEIKSINGTNGFDTIQEAYNAPAIGDISSSPETATLSQIDDGQGLTLWVEYIDYTSPYNEAGDATLLYKFYDASTNYTEQVNLPIVPVEGRPGAINTTAGTLTGTPYDGNGPDRQSGWYQVTVPLAAPGEETKISTLHVSGTKPGGRTLYRDVTYRVMAKQDFTLSATALASEDAGEPTTLKVTLPQYLGYSVFPLTLMIEAQTGNLNPDDDENLSVESGPSLFGTGQNSFYFLKTISYSDYQASRTYQIKFKTTVNGEETALGTNATTIAVKDKNGYFNTGTTSLSILPVGIGPIEQTVKGSAGSAVFNIVSNSDNISNFSWSITNVTTGASFTATSGNSPQELTMSFDPITDPNAEGKEYTATFSYSYMLDGESHSESVQLKVIQSALTLTTKTGQTASFNSSNFTEDNPSANDGFITVEFSAISSINQQYGIVLNQRNNYNVTFTPNSAKNVNITAIRLTFRQGRTNTYNPDEISNFTYNYGTEATYSGSITAPLTATITTRDNRATHITGIEVTYSYNYYE